MRDKQKHAEAKRRWAQRNRHKMRLATRKWAKRNPDKKRAGNQRYVERHRERAREVNLLSYHRRRLVDRDAYRAKRREQYRRRREKLARLAALVERAKARAVEVVAERKRGYSGRLAPGVMA